MSASPNRPRTITLVLWLLIVLGLWQAAKAVALGEQSRLLLDLSVKPDPRLRLVIAVAWMLVFWGLAFALWRRVAATRWLIPLSLALYALYELAILGIFARVSIAEQRWIQYGLITTVSVLFAYWALNRSAAAPYYLEEKTAGG
jgi:hypothetical protein